MIEFPSISRDTITLCKQIVACLLAGLILVDRRFKLPPGIRKGSFSLLGIAGGLLWWNLLQFHYPDRFHYWDYYHYYVGAKYVDEIGYSNLYRCSIVAQSEAGLLEVAPDMMMRELSDNSYVPVSDILRSPELCKSSFSNQRWSEFSSDVLWFRERVGSLWDRIRFDHGFNATPAWLIIGHALVAHTTPSDALFHLLSSIDDILLVMMWCLLWRTFGAISTSVALVYWGTNAIAEYAWTGGALLRHDWLFCLALGIAWLKTGREICSGFFLGVASFLRIFPALVPLIVLLHGAAAILARGLRHVIGENRRFVLGLALAVLIIAPVSTIARFRSGIWQEFSANLTKHNATRSGNSIGLGMIISNVAVCRYGESLDENGQCALSERVNADPAERTGNYIYHLLQGLIMLLFLVVSRGVERWKVAILSIALLPFMANASSYYLEMLALIGLLYAEHRGIGLLLCALAFISQYIAEHVSPPNKVHLVTTVFILQFALCVIYTVCFPASRTLSKEKVPHA